MNQESQVPNNDKKDMFEVTNISNRITSAENFAPNPDETDNQIKQNVCKAGCMLINDNNSRQKCLDDCEKEFPV